MLARVPGFPIKATKFRIHLAYFLRSDAGQTTDRQMTDVTTVTEGSYIYKPNKLKTRFSCLLQDLAWKWSGPIMEGKR